MSWLARLFRGTFVQALRVASVVALARVNEEIDGKEIHGLGPKETKIFKDMAKEAAKAVIDEVISQIEDN